MASQKPLAPLERLPTEILQMILSQMDCTHDLSSAIHASPDLFQAFLGIREQILIRIIQSSLDQDIFMEVLGLLHVPDFSEIHHVPREYWFPSIGDWLEPLWEYDPDDSWRIPLRIEQGRLTKDFQREHFRSLDMARYGRGEPRPFPIPRASHPVDENQVVEFRGAVNTVVEIFGGLRSHMKQIYEGTEGALAQYRYLWIPGASHPDGIDLKSYVTKVDQRRFPLDEQRKFLRELVTEKMAGYPNPSFGTALMLASRSILSNTPADMDLVWKGDGNLVI